MQFQSNRSGLMAQLELDDPEKAVRLVVDGEAQVGELMAERTMPVAAAAA